MLLIQVGAMILLALLATVTPITAICDSYPMLSPDGSMLVFESNRSGRLALWVSKPDGSQPRILFDEPDVGTDPVTPRWSPDGTKIVFGMRPTGSSDPNESDIYLIDAGGKGVRRLTDARGDDSHPHWSADGRRIYFNSARSTPDLNASWGKQWIDVYSMTAAGTGVRRITDCRTLCTYPVPSPDGMHIVYRKVIDVAGRDWSQTRTDRNSEVFVASIDGSGARNLSNDEHYDGWPMWSPDGNWIVFSSNRDGAVNSGQIYRVHPDGSGLEKLTAGPFSHVQPSFARASIIYVYQEMEGPGAEPGGAHGHIDDEIGGIARIDLDR